MPSKGKLLTFLGPFHSQSEYWREGPLSLRIGSDLMTEVTDGMGLALDLVELKLG